MRISDWSSDVCSSDLFGLGAQRVPVMRVQRIERAGGKLVPFPRRQILHAPPTADDEHGFDVMLIMERPFATGPKRGDVEGKAHAVLSQKHPAAFPSLVTDAARSEEHTSELK